MDQGNSVVVIDHNLAPVPAQAGVIKTADHILDLGPGGEIVAEGTPEQVAAVAGSYTGQYLKPMLAKSAARQWKAAE